MNKITCILIISIVSIFSMHYLLYAEVGCLEKSWHLKKVYDYKALHPVPGADKGPCHCPCAKYMAQCRKPLPYGQCPMCKHYRIKPSPIIVTEKVRRQAKQKVTEDISPVAFENQQQAIAILIARSKEAPYVGSTRYFACPHRTSHIPH